MAVKISKEKCTGCSSCVDVCPVEAIKMENEMAIVSDECIECQACLDSCPNSAISL